MTSEIKQGRPGGASNGDGLGTVDGIAVATQDDPVLREIDQLRTDYLALCGAHEQRLKASGNQAEHHKQRAAALEQEKERAQREANQERQQKSALQQQLTGLQAQIDALHGEAQQRDQELESERAMARANEQHAQALTDHLKRIYGSFFRGGVFGMILKACMELTGATKGLYLMPLAAADGRKYRVKDSQGLRKYPGHEPSSFIESLAEKVFQTNDAFLASSRDALKEFPERDDEENFANCIVAPVVIQDKLHGVIVVANKSYGTFTEEDCHMMLSIGSHASVALENMKLQSELRQTHLTTIAVLADAVELKDAYTSGHCQHVSRFSRQVAAELGMNEQEQQLVYYSALLHDVGKIGVADMILLKAGPLLPEEMSLARAHVRLGYELISQIPWLQAVANLVLYHHERWDGAGYPDGLSKTDIPLGSRIVGAVDAYCTMTTRRPYQTGRSKDEAKAELRRSSGSHFDPDVVEALLRVIDMPEELLDAEEAEFMETYGVDEDKAGMQ